VQDGIPGVNTWKGVQTVITDNGFYSGPVDGLPGPNTWKGVQNLAQLGGYGGPVDGFPGDQTYKGLQSWLSEPASPTPTVPAGPTGVYGVDVGPSQSNIDFGLLRDAGYQFSIIKAGGTNLPIYVSTYYQAQVGRARAAGMLVGHYWVVGSNDPAGDASFFLNNLYDFRTGDILALDNEALNVGRVWTDDECATFTQIVKNEVGYAPFIYMNGNRLASSSWAKTRAVGCKLWFTNPNGAPGNITISAFSDWAIHQYSWTGQQGNMKIDLDMAQLSAFAGLTQPPLGETVPPLNAFPVDDGGSGASSISVTAEEGKILQRLAQRGGYEGPVDGIPGGNTWKGVQQVLSDLHYYSGPVDGLPGGNTYRALQTLAREGNYEGPIDGVPGEMTFAALDRYLTGTTGGAPSMANGKILQLIAKAGGYTGAVDGVPGANTWRGLQQVLS
ncbi:peptidase M23, partial [Cryobacterium sp. MLB-32]